MIYFLSPAHESAAAIAAALSLFLLFSDALPLGAAGHAGDRQIFYFPRNPLQNVIRLAIIWLKNKNAAVCGCANTHIPEQVFAPPTQ